MTKWRNKKWTAWLVLLAMLLNILSPMAVFAAEDDGSSLPEITAGGLVMSPVDSEEAADDHEPIAEDETEPEEETPTEGDATLDTDMVGGEMETEASEPTEEKTDTMILPLAAQLSPKRSMDMITVTVEVNTYTVDGEQVLSSTAVQVEQGASALEATKAALEQAEISIETGTGSYGDWVESIAGYSADSVREMIAGIPADYWPGWAFSVDDVVASVYPSGYTLRNGEHITWDFSVTGMIQKMGVTPETYFYPDIELMATKMQLEELILEAQGVVDGLEEGSKKTSLLKAIDDAKALLSDIQTKAESAGCVGQYLINLGTMIYGPGSDQDKLEKAALAIKAQLDLDYVPVTSIAIVPESVYVGQTKQLQVKILPENATDQAVSWEILFNDEFGTINEETGELTGLKEGNGPFVAVTLKADSSKSATAVISILPVPSEIEQQEAAERALNDAADWLKQQHGDFAIRKGDPAPDVDTTAFLLARLNRMSGEESSQYYNALTHYIQEQVAAIYTTTSWQKIIGAVNGLGYQPQAVGGVDFVDKMMGYDFAGGYRDIAVCTGILKTLQNKNFVPINYTAEEVINGLLAYQNADGGFGFSSSYANSSVDNAGDALLALAPYRQQAHVQLAINRGLAYLSAQQSEDGGYGNSNSTARALLGLSALEIDPLTDSRFIKNGSNMVSYLLTLQNDDGSFAWQTLGDPNAYATIDAVQALSAYMRMIKGQEGLYDLTNVGISKEALEIQIAYASAIDGDGYTVSSFAKLKEAIDAAKSCTDAGQYAQMMNALRSAEENLKKALPIDQGTVDLGTITNTEKLAIEVKKDGAPLTINQGESTAEVYLELAADKTLPEITIESVLNSQPVTVVFPAGITADTDTIALPLAQSVAGEQIKQAVRNLAQNNVEIKQYFHIGGSSKISFSDYVFLTLPNMKDFKPAYVDAKGKVLAIPAKDATHSQNDYYTISGEDLVIATKHFTGFLLYKTVGSSGGSGESVVHITVDASRASAGGFGTESGTIAYYDGIDAVQALKNFVGEGNVEVDNGYVSTIRGLAQLDNGPESGWMYSINGVFPDIAAQNLFAGDTLYWGYTLDLGNDLKSGSAAGGGTVNKVALTDKEQVALAASAQKALTAVRQAVLKKDSLTPWEAFALAAGGEVLPEAVYEQLVAEVQAAKGDFRKVTDTEKMILAVTAMGKNAVNVGGYDLLKAVYNHTDLTKQGNNGIIYALLALDCGQYTVPSDAQWNRTKLVDYLLAQQNHDGGYALTKGSASDVDLTAMALQALAPYREQAKVKLTINKALAFLSQGQRADGSFASNGVVNSESAAQVLLALTALGIDPVTDSRFIRDEVTVWDQLLSFQLSDGTFAHTIKGESDELATEQGLLALTAMQRFLTNGKGIFDGYTAGEPKAGFFTDSAAISSWAIKAVQTAADQGLVVGFADGTFRPKQAVSRAEFVSLLLRVDDQPMIGSGVMPFDDVAAESWYAVAAAAAYEQGLVKGADGRFGGGDTLTREEMAAMLCRAMELAEIQQPVDLVDGDQIAPWARGAVNAVYEAGLMVGAEGAFDPQGAVTREMAAAVVLRLAS